MKVIKNSLARIAAKETPFSELSEQFTQTRALIYSDSDPVMQAKVLIHEAKDIENLKILGGILVSDGNTNILTSEEVDNEKEWMAAHIYNGDFQGRIDEIALTDKHKF